MQSYLKQMETAAAAFAKGLEGRKRRGKKWYSDLCRQHVYLCDLFFEFLDEKVEPARTKGFSAAVRLMARPVFPPDVQFVAAIRESSENLKRSLGGRRQIRPSSSVVANH